MSNLIPVKSGAAIPLTFVAKDGTTSLAVTARVETLAGVQVAGSPFALAHTNNGQYTGNTGVGLADASYRINYLPGPTHEQDSDLARISDIASDVWDVVLAPDHIVTGTSGGSLFTAAIGRGSEGLTGTLGMLPALKGKLETTINLKGDLV